ncbi:MAG: glycosyltransferase family 2 protein [Blastocatellia bacterium]|nr:glycosyltransferase family 2 protein [Blastocatellia bacterium]
MATTHPHEIEKNETAPCTTRKDVTVLIPVYNEEENLETLYSRLSAVLSGCTASYEMVFINDGSADRSLAMLRGFQENDPQHVVVIDLTRNFGQHPAIVAGFHHCRGDAVILIDADLQNPPEEIPHLLAKFYEGFDVVYGIRRQREDQGWRKLGSRSVVWLMEKLLGVQLPTDMVSNFRVIHRRVVAALNKVREQQYDYALMMAWMGFSHAGVEVGHASRAAGESKYSTWKLVLLTLDMLIGFSDAPLRLASICGAMLAVVSILAGLYQVAQRLLGVIDVEGYTSLFLGITFLAGIQLLFLGVIGEYVARIYREIKGRPYYVVNRIYQQEE